MLWGAIVYGYDESVLPYHVYYTPYDTNNENSATDFILH